MLIARFIFELTTPLHCGGGDDPFLDQPVSRDPFGYYHIPATSLAGVLRSTVAHTDVAPMLFGTCNGDHSKASLVWCSDALLLDYDGKPCCNKAISGLEIKLDTDKRFFIRDHVKLNLEYGIADEGGKFDEEIVPPGARFAFELKLDGWDHELTEDEKLPFYVLINAIKDSTLNFGGKKVSGYGSYKILYAECREFNLTSERGLLSWLNLSDGPKFNHDEGVVVSVPEIKQTMKATADEMISFSLEAPLTSMGPVMVGGNNLDDKDVDITCIQTPFIDYSDLVKNIIFRYTLPGSAIRGAVRHRVFEIAKAINLADPLLLVDKLFGNINGENTTCGKLEFEDIYPENAASIHIQHVAIDKLTGGALDGALFDEKPLWSSGMDLKLKVRARNLTPLEGKIVAHAMIDLFTGTLPIGGGINRGNGRVQLKGIGDCLNPDWNALRGINFKGIWEGVGELDSYTASADEANDFLELLDGAE